MVYSGRCSVTGNLISAEAGGDPQTSTSLTIVPEGFHIISIDDRVARQTIRILAPHLAVSGNVLEGASNLVNLVRPDGIAPFETWLPFNATA